MALTAPRPESSSLFPLRGELDTLYRPVNTVSGLALQPFKAVQPAGNGIHWGWMQEGGVNVPRTYFKVGNRPLEMDVPEGEAIEFTLRVLPSFRPEDQRVAQTQQANGVRLSKLEEGYIATAHGAGFTGGEELAADAAAAAADLERSLIPESIEQITEHRGHEFAMKEGYMSLAYTVNSTQPAVNAARPRWRCSNLSVNPEDGLRLVVFGDGSGANLVVTLHARGRRDYVFPIDFTGRRELWIPASFAAWSRADWGWRSETMHFSHGRLRSGRDGFRTCSGRVSPRVTIESLDLVAGYTTEVNKLSLLLGDSALQIDGPVYSGEYIWYQGGDEVQVYDLNWNLRRLIPIKRKGLQLEGGNYPMYFWAQTVSLISSCRWSVWGRRLSCEPSRLSMRHRISKIPGRAPDRSQVQGKYGLACRSLSIQFTEIKTMFRQTQSH